jgi:hypothetical protein
VRPDEEGARSAGLQAVRSESSASLQVLSSVTAGAQLMAQLLDGVAKHPDDVKEVYLHVQTSNDDAVRFYRRLGFDLAETVENYYRGIDPPHCKPALGAPRTCGHAHVYRFSFRCPVQATSCESLSTVAAQQLQLSLLRLLPISCSCLRNKCPLLRYFLATMVTNTTAQEEPSSST